MFTLILKGRYTDSTHKAKTTCLFNVPLVIPLYGGVILNSCSASLISTVRTALWGATKEYFGHYINLAPSSPPAVLVILWSQVSLGFVSYLMHDN